MSELKIESGAIDPSGCISQGWELIKSDYGLFILMAFLFIVLTLITSNVPYIGGIINVLISGPLMCGIYKTLLMKRRGEIISLSNMFDGFKSFGASFLVTLVPIIPTLIFGIVVGVVMGMTNYANSTGNNDIFRGIPIFLIVSGIIVYFFVLFLQILLFFALPLVAEHDLGAVDAIKLSFRGVSQNVGGIIVLCLLEFLIMIGGVIALCIGIIFALPLVYAANTIAYKSVFPDMKNSFYNEPPQPDYYNSAFGTNN